MTTLFSTEWTCYNLLSPQLLDTEVDFHFVLTQTRLEQASCCICLSLYLGQIPRRGIAAMKGISVANALAVVLVVFCLFVVIVVAVVKVLDPHGQLSLQRAPTGLCCPGKERREGEPTR